MSAMTLPIFASLVFSVLIFAVVRAELGDPLFQTTIPALNSEFKASSQLAYIPSTETIVFLSNTNCEVRQWILSPSTTSSLPIAGGGSCGAWVDAGGTSARFTAPQGLLILDPKLFPELLPATFSFGLLVSDATRLRFVNLDNLDVVTCAGTGDTRFTAGYKNQSTFGSAWNLAWVTPYWNNPQTQGTQSYDVWFGDVVNFILIKFQMYFSPSQSTSAFDGNIVKVVGNVGNRGHTDGSFSSALIEEVLSVSGIKNGTLVFIVEQHAALTLPGWGLRKMDMVNAIISDTSPSPPMRNIYCVLVHPKYNIEGDDLLLLLGQTNGIAYMKGDTALITRFNYYVKGGPFPVRNMFMFPNETLMLGMPAFVMFVSLEVNAISMNNSDAIFNHSDIVFEAPVHFNPICGKVTCKNCIFKKAVEIQSFCPEIALYYNATGFAVLFDNCTFEEGFIVSSILSSSSSLENEADNGGGLVFPTSSQSIDVNPHFYIINSVFYQSFSFQNISYAAKNNKSWSGFQLAPATITNLKFRAENSTFLACQDLHEDVTELLAEMSTSPSLSRFISEDLFPKHFLSAEDYAACILRHKEEMDNNNGGGSFKKKTEAFSICNISSFDLNGDGRTEEHQGFQNSEFLFSQNSLLSSLSLNEIPLLGGGTNIRFESGTSFLYLPNRSAEVADNVLLRSQVLEFKNVKFSGQGSFVHFQDGFIDAHVRWRAQDTLKSIIAFAGNVEFCNGATISFMNMSANFSIYFGNFFATKNAVFRNQSALKWDGFTLHSQSYASNVLFSITYSTVISSSLILFRNFRYGMPAWGLTPTYGISVTSTRVNVSSQFIFEDLQINVGDRFIFSSFAGFWLDMNSAIEMRNSRLEVAAAAFRITFSWIYQNSSIILRNNSLSSENWKDLGSVNTPYALLCFIDNQVHFRGNSQVLVTENNISTGDLGVSFGSDASLISFRSIEMSDSEVLISNNFLNGSGSSGITGIRFHPRMMTNATISVMHNTMTRSWLSVEKNGAAWDVQSQELQISDMADNVFRYEGNLISNFDMGVVFRVKQAAERMRIDITNNVFDKMSSNIIEFMASFSVGLLHSFVNVINNTMRVENIKDYESKTFRIGFVVAGKNVNSTFNVTDNKFSAYDPLPTHGDTIGFTAFIWSILHDSTVIVQRNLVDDVNRSVNAFPFAVLNNAENNKFYLLENNFTAQNASIWFYTEKSEYFRDNLVVIRGNYLRCLLPENARKADGEALHRYDSVAIYFQNSGSFQGNDILIEENDIEMIPMLPSQVEGAKAGQSATAIRFERFDREGTCENKAIPLTVTYSGTADWEVDNLSPEMKTIISSNFYSCWYNFNIVIQKNNITSIGLNTSHAIYWINNNEQGLVEANASLIIRENNFRGGASLVSTLALFIQGVLCFQSCTVLFENNSIVNLNVVPFGAKKGSPIIAVDRSQNFEAREILGVVIGQTVAAGENMTFSFRRNFFDFTLTPPSSSSVLPTKFTGFSFLAVEMYGFHPPGIGGVNFLSEESQVNVVNDPSLVIISSTVLNISDNTLSLNASAAFSSNQDNDNLSPYHDGIYFGVKILNQKVTWAAAGPQRDFRMGNVFPAWINATLIMQRNDMQFLAASKMRGIVFEETAPWGGVILQISENKMEMEQDVKERQEQWSVAELALSELHPNSSIGILFSNETLINGSLWAHWIFPSLSDVNYYVIIVKGNVIRGRINGINEEAHGNDLPFYPLFYNRSVDNSYTFSMMLKISENHFSWESSHAVNSSTKSMMMDSIVSEMLSGLHRDADNVFFPPPSPILNIGNRRIRRVVLGCNTLNAKEISLQIQQTSVPNANVTCTLTPSSSLTEKSFSMSSSKKSETVSFSSLPSPSTSMVTSLSASMVPSITETNSQLSETSTITVTPPATKSHSKTITDATSTISSSGPEQTNTESIPRTPTPVPTKTQSLSLSPCVQSLIPRTPSTLSTVSIHQMDVTSNGVSVTSPASFMQDWMTMHPFGTSIHEENFAVSLEKSPEYRSDPLGFHSFANMKKDFGMELIAVNSTALQIKMKRPQPGYSIEVDETLRFYLLPLYFDQCPPPSSVEVALLTVIAPLSPVAAAVTKTTEAISTAAVGAGAIGATGSSGDAQTLAVIGFMSCASPGERKMMANSKLLAPFALNDSFAAMVIANVSIILLFAALQLVVVKIKMKCSQCSWDEARAFVRYPSLACTLLTLLYQGTALAAIKLMTSSQMSPGEITLGTFGLFFACVTPVFFYLIAKNQITARFSHYVYKDWEKKIKVPPFVVKLFFPVGRWEPKIARKIFGVLMSSRRRQELIWTSFTLWGPSAMIIISTFRPKSNDGCAVQYGVLALVQFLLAIIVAIFRPYRVHAGNILSIISSLCLMLVLICSGITVRTPTSTFAKMLMLVAVQAQMMITGLRILLSFGGSILEHFYINDVKAPCPMDEKFFWIARKPSGYALGLGNDYDEEALFGEELLGKVLEDPLAKVDDPFDVPSANESELEDDEDPFCLIDKERKQKKKSNPLLLSKKHGAAVNQSSSSDESDEGSVHTFSTNDSIDAIMAANASAKNNNKNKSRSSSTFLSVLAPVQRRGEDNNEEPRESMVESLAKDPHARQLGLGQFDYLRHTREKPSSSPVQKTNEVVESLMAKISGPDGVNPKSSSSSSSVPKGRSRLLSLFNSDKSQKTASQKRKEEEKEAEEGRRRNKILKPVQALLGGSSAEEDDDLLLTNNKKSQKFKNENKKFPSASMEDPFHEVELQSINPLGYSLPIPPPPKKANDDHKKLFSYDKNGGVGKKSENKNYDDDLDLLMNTTTKSLDATLILPNSSMACLPPTPDPSFSVPTTVTTTSHPSQSAGTKNNASSSNNNLLRTSSSKAFFSDFMDSMFS